MQPRKSSKSVHAATALALGLALAASTPARADAGTPLMWATMLHLTILNALIGLFEAFLISRIFDLPRPSTNGWSILANYFSAWVGVFTLGFIWLLLMKLLPGAPLYKAGPVLVLVVAISWVMSVVLEWPFFALAFPRGPDRGRLSFRASLIAQTASYVLLILFYLAVSPTNLVRGNHLEHTLRFVKAPIATVYYIDQADGWIWRIRTDGKSKARVLDARIHDGDVRLVVLKNDQTGRWDLFKVSPSANYTDGYPTTMLIANVGRTGAAPDEEGRICDTWSNFGRPSDFRPAEKRQWDLETGFWASDGLIFSHGNGSKEDITFVDALAFDTPFAHWFCRNITILPGDQAVAQLGYYGNDDQIVMVDLPTQKVGFLTMGQGPAVVLN